jgi:chondroitin 4-sulfotransferase 11
MISHTHKCIYVHIPKTGGTSLRVAFRKPERQAGMAHKQTYQQDIISKYYVWTVVRNPWDRLVSEYHFRRRRGLFRQLDYRHCSFVDFCELLFSGELQKIYPKSQVIHLWPQLQVINYNVNDMTNVDFIGRFENLQDDFNVVCDKIGFPHRKLPHIHKTKHKHYTEYYDDETKQIVAEKYAKDIEYFGYEFGE